MKNKIINNFNSNLEKIEELKQKLNKFEFETYEKVIIKLLNELEFDVEDKTCNQFFINKDETKTFSISHFNNYIEICKVENDVKVCWFFKENGNFSTEELRYFVDYLIELSEFNLI